MAGEAKAAVEPQKSIEDVLAELVPHPTAQDTDDMVTIAFAYARIVARRNRGLENALGKANGMVKALTAKLEQIAAAAPA